MSKRKLFSTKQIDSLSHIKNMIECHIWCPPSSILGDDTKCAVCGENIITDEKTSYDYAVWVGFVCLECAKRYEKEIENLSCM